MSETTDARPLPPGPDGLPVLGNTVGFLRDPFAFYDALAEHGDVVRYEIAGNEMATVLHPDHVERVLVDDFESYRKPERMADVVEEFSEGLLLTEGDQWRAQRTLLQPMFYRERVEAYGDTMSEYAARAAEEWGEQGELDVVEATSAFTLRVLGKTLLGVDTAERREAVRAGAEAIRERGEAGSLATELPDWLPLPSNRRYQRRVGRFDDAVRSLVDERRASDEDGDDLLSLLLDAEYPDGTSPDEREIRDQLMTFLFAGHETSALALTWTLYELGRKPDVAERLRAEVDDVLDGDTATLADLPDLDFTEQVVSETLRRYPPAAVVFREALSDAELGDYRVPEGTMLTVPQFRLHTDQRWWDDPEAFDPSRWDDTDGAGDPPDGVPEYAYFPFGGGPRHCIGMRFAMLELKVALATFAKQFTVHHDHGDVGAELGATFHPETEIRATFEPR